MTTLAYRDGVLAADTQITYGSILIPGGVKKIHKLSNGTLYGFVGSLEIGEIMRRYLDSVAKGDNVLQDREDLRNESFEAILVQPNGDTYFFENRTWVPLTLPFVAMGSGKECAYGALELGASARQAVKAAMSLDMGTGGKVNYISCPKWKGERSYVEQCWEELK